MLLRGIATTLLVCAPAIQAQNRPTMTHHAQGTFTVDMKPLTPAPADGLARFSIDKQIHGDLEGVSKGEMITGGDPKQGVVTGTLQGQKAASRCSIPRESVETSPP